MRDLSSYGMLLAAFLQDFECETRLVELYFPEDLAFLIMQCSSCIAMLSK
jgi:hypothetical protein